MSVTMSVMAALLAWPPHAHAALQGVPVLSRGARGAAWGLRGSSFPRPAPRCCGGQGTAALLRQASENLHRVKGLMGSDRGTMCYQEEP